MTALVLSFLPDVNGTEGSVLLARCLLDCGYREKERIRHSSTNFFPELERRMQDYPGAQALTWFHRVLADETTNAVVINHVLERPQWWDLRLVRSLSAAVGGFAAVMESIRSQDRYGIAVFYAGRTIEAFAYDAGRKVVQLGDPMLGESGARTIWNDETIWDAFQRYFVAIAGGQEMDLRLQGKIELESWILEHDGILGSAFDVNPTEESRFSRAAFANVEEATFRKAIQEVGSQTEQKEEWRWLMCESPIASVPYVIMQCEGSLDKALITELARRCDCFAIGIDLTAQDHAFTWIQVEPGGRVRGGSEFGAKNFIGQWATFCITMGETPGSVRWPHGRAGYPLS